MRTGYRAEPQPAGRPAGAADRRDPVGALASPARASVREGAQIQRGAQAVRRGVDVQNVGLIAPLYNLANEQVEYRIRDRLSFARFLGFGYRGRSSGCHHGVAFSGAAAGAGVAGDGVRPL